ncbi:hypothetical protein RFI_01183 [Reticulomyxa filosa]|uniref:Kelch motif family protein n=1 Tax=Reticulomyxa filosa TaxID=46433 RepID=X6PCV9_RETFI|nr:hypothetical protein RFI_01183 [Reticulomyxa filosa]|eukprot:ETO35879.1 hypothetical protein RFI_01183 [Reticulomyxa filosa]
MKYVNVWRNDDDNENENENETNKLNELNKSNNYNQWVPFTDNHNNPIIIGRDQDNYEGVRALVGGINNYLLFITYLKNNISVFDLNTFQFIKHDTLPTDNNIWYHCFVSKLENGQVQEMMKANQKYKQNYQMLLFCWNTGLSIEYDGDNNIFKFRQLYVCKDIAPFYQYAYTYINDVILFFGGSNYTNISKSVHKYLIQENTWTTFQNSLSNPLNNCVAILNEEDNNVHIIGGIDDEDTKVLTHMKTKVRAWGPLQLVMICLFIIYLF